jgi:predicted Zn-dependent protease
MDMNAVSIVENDEPYASTDGHSIYVNPQFMSKIDSSAGEGGVRFVLAHELGHVHNGMCGGHDGELFCDEFGARSIAAMGYDEKVIHSVMAELSSDATDTHPASSTRATRASQAHAAALKSSAEVTAPAAEVTHARASGPVARSMR